MDEIGTREDLAITLNGEPVTTPARTLHELVEQQRLTSLKVATALNGRFVAQSQRATTALTAGDRVEIVSPRQGG
jgi:sulfur carrier protein